MQTKLKTLLLFATSILFVQQNALAAFEFELDSLEVSGAVTFFDEFEDDLRDSSPTSLLVDWLGNVSETGGSLVFSDADGAGVPGGEPPGTLNDTVFLNSFIPDDGIETTLTGSFVPHLGDIMSMPLGTGYGIQFNNACCGSPIFNQATLGVFSDGLGNAVIGLLGNENMIIESAIVGSATGNIFLSLTVDPSTDIIMGSYSLDGGTTFMSFASTASVSGELVPWVFGQQGAPVPLPAAWVCFASALVLFRGLIGRKF